jgi:acyl dehydratase
MNDAKLHLEDLPVGTEFSCGRFTFSRDDIIEFARRFDPQPFHLDDEAARHSYFVGLCASGVHSQAACIGLMVRAIANVAVIAGGSLDRATFLAPVRPGQAYDVTAAWTKARPSSRNPARGVASLAGTARDAAGATVMTFGVTYVVARRSDPAPQAD